MGTTLDSSHEAREAREKTPEKELKPRLRKPYVWRADNQLSTRRQMFACRFEEEVGIAKVLNAFATDNGFVMPQVIWKAHVEVDVTKLSISFG